MSSQRKGNMRLVHYSDIPVFKERGYVVIKMASNGDAYMRTNNQKHDKRTRKQKGK